MNQSILHEKTGYLHQNFRLFHIKDQVKKEFDYHYHDFHKAVFFLSGKVTYHIEGKAYHLKPGDLLLVNHYALHKPQVDSSVPYERIILWCKDTLRYSHMDPGCDLYACFQKVQKKNLHLIRPTPTGQKHLLSLLSQLEVSLSSSEFGSELLNCSLFLQCMIQINRIAQEKKEEAVSDFSYTYDSTIDSLLQYINRNLTSDLSMETLLEQCYLSKYHLMRKFKAQTGCTIHKYISDKRLFLARTLIQENTPVMKAALQCGFHDYTTFSRAYKKMFGSSPSHIEEPPLKSRTSE